MDTVSPRDGAATVKAITGYDERGWQIFLRVTRIAATELMGVIGVISPGLDIEETNLCEIRQFASRVRALNRGVSINTWDILAPGDQLDAAKTVNSILAQHNLPAVSRQVLQWRMIHAFRYLRRDVRRIGDPTLALSKKSATKPLAPAAHGDNSEPALPPLRSVVPLPYQLPTGDEKASTD